MIDITLLMDRTEQLARESGIALFPGNARAYAKYDEPTDSVLWVICEQAPIGIRTEPQVMKRWQAVEILECIAQGLTY